MILDLPNSNPPLGPAMNKVIAIDFDDTCCQTTQEWNNGLNKLFGYKTNIEELESYFAFHNPNVGTVCEGSRKFDCYRKSGEFTAIPVEGMQAAVMQLHKAGYKLHIITNRNEATGRPYIEEWLVKHGITHGEGGIITSIHFMIAAEDCDPPIPEEVGSTESAIEREKELNQFLRNKWKDERVQNKFGSAKVRTARELGASILIDDRYYCLCDIQKEENNKIMRGILFGPYKWCDNDIDFSHPHHMLTYDQRQAIGAEFPRKPVEMGKGLYRAKNWEEVLELVKKWETEEIEE